MLGAVAWGGDFTLLKEGDGGAKGAERGMCLDLACGREDEALARNGLESWSGTTLAAYSIFVENRCETHPSVDARRRRQHRTGALAREKAIVVSYRVTKVVWLKLDRACTSEASDVSQGGLRKRQGQTSSVIGPFTLYIYFPSSRSRDNTCISHLMTAAHS